MTDDPHSSETTSDTELVGWLRELLEEHAPTPRTHSSSDVVELLPTTAGPPRRRRAPLVASLTLIAAGTVGAFYLGTVDRDHSETSSSAASTATALPANDPALLPPGIGLSGSSVATAKSSAVAARIADVLAGDHWVVEGREHATRVVAGAEIEWVYFSDGDLRLLFAVGSADLLDSFAYLRDQLTSVDGGFDWPNQSGATTVAVTSDDHTVIVRSESVQEAGPTRTRDELRQLANEVLENLADT